MFGIPLPALPAELFLVRCFSEPDVDPEVEGVLDSPCGEATLRVLLPLHAESDSDVRSIVKHRLTSLPV